MPKALFSRTMLAATMLTVAVIFSQFCLVRADLTLSRMVWDFGSIEQGQTKTQKIVLTNPDEQPLKVEKVELPEGCSLNPGLDDTEIKPDQNLEVEFTFDSKGILGKIQQYAYVFSSASGQETIATFTIKGEVFEKGQPRLRVTPSTWDFGTVTTGESREQTFRCENAGTAELKVEKVQIYDSRFKVSRNITKENLAPGDKADFVVSVTGAYEGSYEHDFYIKSNSVGRTFTKIGIKGHVVRKTSGLVVSPTLSSFTNNTVSNFEVTRSDKLGRTETITVERDSTKSFPPEPGAPPRTTSPTDYTLTIKLARPAIPPPKPAEKKPPPEKPAPPAPKPEGAPGEEKPAEAAAPSPESPPTGPEESRPPGQPAEKEQEPAPTPKPQKEEPSKAPEKPAPEPHEGKPSEVKTSPPKETPSPEVEKAAPAEKPRQKEEKKPEGSEEKEQTGPAIPSDKKESEKTPEGTTPKPDNTKPSGEKAVPLPAEPSKPPGSGKPPSDK